MKNQSEFVLAHGQRLVCDLDACTGCRACTLACSFEHYGVFNPELSRIRVIKMEDQGLDCPVFCQHCADAVCIESCAFEAISRDAASGLVVFDRDACTGCGVCAQACPLGAVSLPPKELRQTEKNILQCDRCGGTPQCIAWCETGALKIVYAGEIEQVKQSRENMLLGHRRFQIETRL